MAATYAMCTNCGNPKEGDSIFRCPECGKICCTNCTQYKGWYGTCPQCGYDEIKYGHAIGEIGRF